MTSGVAAPPHAIRLAGLTIPGLANAHSHAFHRVLRGRTQQGAGSLWFPDANAAVDTTVRLLQAFAADGSWRESTLGSDGPCIGAVSSLAAMI